MFIRLLALLGMFEVGVWLQATPPVQSGVDAGSGVTYALIAMEGRFVGSGPRERSPRVTAQCTKDSRGKLRFELLFDQGDVPELRFVAPWRPTPGKVNDFPPVLRHVTVTMEFLGYTKVKPVRRQWVAIDGLPEEWKYAAPGLSSANLEEITFYLQYLKALPTLRLTWPGAEPGKSPVVTEFETTKWQAQVKAEPLCGASGW
jgi:hypothetical protein